MPQTLAILLCFSRLSSKMFLFFLYALRTISREFFFFFYWLRHLAYRILVPQPGIEPGPPAVETWGPNHWTSREFPPETLSEWFLNNFQ